VTFNHHFDKNDNRRNYRIIFSMSRNDLTLKGNKYFDYKRSNIFSMYRQIITIS